MSIADKLVTIAENEQKVYEAGKQAEYDAFWDSTNTNGDSNKNIDWTSMFGGALCNNKTFVPKYNIRPKGYCGSLFYSSGVTDLKAALEKAGKVLDLSGVTAIGSTWQNSKITHCPEIDLSNCTQISNLFYGCVQLHTIEKIKISEKLTTATQLFNSCKVLENITFEGVLNCNGVSVSPVTLLTKESLLSLLNVLKDNSTTGVARTVTLGSTNLAKLTDSEKAIATQKGWTLA